MSLAGLFKERVLTAEVWLPRPRAEVFPFFADAANLNAITPPWLSFTIVTPQVDMRPGAIIDYSLRIRGFPISWRTLITAWEPPLRFIDEQVRGPYLQWIHEHTFNDEVRDGVPGTLCRDHVRYKHIGGPIAQSLLVGPDLQKVFAHRTKRLLEIFPAAPSAQPKNN